MMNLMMAVAVLVGGQPQFGSQEWAQARARAASYRQTPEQKEAEDIRNAKPKMAAELGGAKPSGPDDTETRVNLLMNFMLRQSSEATWDKVAVRSFEMDAVRFGSFPFDYSVKVYRKDPDTGNLILQASGRNRLLGIASEELGKYKILNFYLDNSSSVVVQDGWEFPKTAIFYRTGKIRDIQFFGRVEVIESTETEKWKPIWLEARSRLADAAQRKAKAEMEAKEMDRKAEEAKVKAANLAKLDRKKADDMAAAKLAVTKTCADIEKSVANYRKLDSEMPSGWQTQIGFSANAIKRHIAKLEKSKSDLSKHALTATEKASLESAADSAIALGKATLAKGSAK